MSIVTTVSSYDFERAFADMGRNDSFSASGLNALYEYLEEYSEGTGEPIELDVIGLCGDFSEHDVADLREEFAGHYDGFPEMHEGYDDEDNEDEIIDWLESHTSVIRFDRVVTYLGTRPVKVPAVVIQSF